MAEQYNRRFEGIWIPSNIWLSDELTMQEKLFLVEIKSLDNEQGCFASNDHFSKLFQLSKSRCSEVINSLKDKGIIQVHLKYREGTKQVERRTMRINYFHDVFKGIRDFEGGIRNPEAPLRNIEDPPSEKAKDNNTLFNNTTNNTDKDIDKRQSSVSPLIESDFVTIKNLFEENVRAATYRDSQAISEAMEFYETPLILEAVKAGGKQARSFQYILGILDNWRTEFKVKTYDDWVSKLQTKEAKPNGQNGSDSGRTPEEMEMLEKLKSYNSYDYK